MENPFGVVKAGPADEAAIFDVLCGLHAENGMWPMNPLKCKAEIWDACHGRVASIIGLIKDKAGAIEGVVWITLEDTWYSDWVNFCERLLYVIPEKRRSTHAKRLAQFAKWCSDAMSEALPKEPGQQQEIPLIIGIVTAKALEQKMRLYQRQFRQVGALFQYRLVPDEAYNQRHIHSPTQQK